MPPTLWVSDSFATEAQGSTPQITKLANEQDLSKVHQRPIFKTDFTNICHNVIVRYNSRRFKWPLSKKTSFFLLRQQHIRFSTSSLFPLRINFWNDYSQLGYRKTSTYTRQRKHKKLEIQLCPAGEVKPTSQRSSGRILHASECAATVISLNFLLKELAFWRNGIWGLP